MGRGLSRLYNLDQKYFDLIDNPKKAYILGFLYADGCVFVRPKCSGCFVFVNSKDIEIIDFIRSELTDKPIFTTNRGLVGLNLYSKYLAKSLIDRGCIERKSLTLEFPREDQVPKSLMQFFIRGKFDGDGCVCFSQEQQLVRFSTSYKFALGLQNFLDLINIKSYVTDSKKNCFYLSICAREDFIKFYEFLYAGGGFKLDRKYRKFLEILDSRRFSVSSNELKRQAFKHMEKGYRFLSPNGEIVEVLGLNRFCKDNCLDASNMCSVAKGSRVEHKGWRLAK